MEINGYFQNSVLFLHNHVCVVADFDIFNSVRGYKGMEFFPVLNLLWPQAIKMKSEVLFKLRVPILHWNYYNGNTAY